MAFQRKSFLWAGVLTFGVILLLISFVNHSFISGLEDQLTHYLNEESEYDDDDEASENITPLTVRLDDDAIEYVGVVTIPLKSSVWSPEKKAQAYVVDTRQLVMSMAQLKQAEVEFDLAQVVEESARNEFSRIKKLVTASAGVANKKVVAAEAEWKTKKAELEIKKAVLTAINAETSLRWGSKITEWLKSQNSPFSKLLSRELVLIVLSIPVAHSLNDQLEHVVVSSSSERASAQVATYVAPAHIDAKGFSGETHYFLTTAEHLRPGMNLDAWVQQSEEALHGFMIPDAAVVWYTGQPWAYIEVDEGVYKRKALASGQSVSGGVFLDDGFNEGDALVISGAQMLLSEEFRWQIHDEDDD